jgi:hypothetical protein
MPARTLFAALGRYLSVALLGIALVPSAPARADDSWIVDEPLNIEPALIAHADLACQLTLEESNLAPDELEDILAAAVAGIRAKIATPKQAVDAVGLAADLEKIVGPLDLIPSIALHQALADLSKTLGDHRRQQLHQTLAFALLGRMERQGLGQSFDQALQPCLIENEYGWLALRAGLGERQTQKTVSHNGQAYDVLEIRDRTRNLRSVYFDIDALWQAYQRREDVENQLPTTQGPSTSPATESGAPSLSRPPQNPY